ncbi:MAG: amidase [Thermoleophilia bacterium]|nr:amidase [Thermoleophilia bacterium]
MLIPEYDRLDAVALAGLVAEKKVAPLELLEAAIERVEARNGRINAVVHRFYDEARKVAAGPLPEGPFRGVPFLLKDLNAAYAGQPLTAGCRMLKDYVPAFDSEAVRRFKAAGLVTFGKTNTPELGIMGTTEPVLFGPTRNPWNVKHTSGGSSGGSAAAVAARMVPMAHGGDGGGSIRIPASACGLFGLKPTRGRVSLAPSYGESWGGMVQEHVLTRSVRDSAAMLDVLSGNVAGDPYWAPPVARPFKDEVGAPPGRLKVAFTRAPLFGNKTHPDCEAALDSALKLLAELGHEVIEARPDFSRDELVRAYFLVVASGVASDMATAMRLTGKKESGAMFEPVTRALGLAGQKSSALAQVQAEQSMHRAGRSLAAFFGRFDVMVTPTLAQPPIEVNAPALKLMDRISLGILLAIPIRPMINALLDQMPAEALEPTPNTQLFNQTGQPAMSVPLHWNSAGLPIGVQVAGRFGDEATLLRLAAQLEQARPWADRVPEGL